MDLLEGEVYAYNSLMWGNRNTFSDIKKKIGM